MRRPPGHPAFLPMALLLSACGLEARPDGRPESRTSAVTERQTPDGRSSDPTGCREVLSLLHVQRFTLSEPHEYHSMKDHPDITAGTLIVIEVEPECARPRQVAMPVLYVGQVPAEIAKDGYPLGRLIAIVPGHVDLTKTPVFYGAPELPERVDSQRGARELEAALAAGVVPFSAGAVTAAQAGSVLALAGTTELYRKVAEIDARYHDGKGGQTSLIH